MDFCWQSMSLLFNMLSRLVITFLPRSKRLLISWLQSPSSVILEPKKIKSVTVSIVSLSICHEVMGPDAMILVFWMLSFKPAFSLSSLTFIKRLFSCSLLSAMWVVSSVYEVINISPRNSDISLCFIQHISSDILHDLGLIPGLGRSLGGGHGNPFRYSCLGNPMDRGTWHGVAKSQTPLSN